MELDRKDSPRVKERQEESAVQRKVQEEPQTVDLQDSAREVALHKS